MAEVDQSSRATNLLPESVRNQREEHYRQLSKRLEVILEGVSDGVTAQDPSGRLVFANSAAAAACGFSSATELMKTPPEEIVARFEMLDEQGEAFPIDRLPGRRVLRGEDSASAVIRVRERKSGREWWSKVSATGVLGSQGEPVLAINVWHDITAERRREREESYLVRASAALGESLDYEATLRTLASLLVPGLADWCSIRLLDGEELRNVVVAHCDPRRVVQAQDYEKKYPPRSDSGRGPWQVLRTGQAELYPEVTDAMLMAAAQDPEHLQILREADMRSVLIVPIRHHERILGTISLISSGSGRRYDQHDVGLAEELGRRIGSAIDNARLYAAESKARERLALLARAGEAFSSSLVYEQVLYSVVQIALPELGDFAFFDICEGDQVRRVAASHDDPDTERLIRQTHWVKSERTDMNLCALSSGEPCFHPRIDEAWVRNAAINAEHRALLQRLELSSMISVPIRSNQRVSGALTFCYGKSRRRHAEDDLELAAELARRAGIAVAQARLFVEAKDAARIAESSAKSAEEASRVKDEFLATVSHELRTPLTAILGWATVLRERRDEPHLSKGIEVIYRNALSQSKLIEDILDMSRIVAGKLRLEPRPSDATRIVRDAIEALRPSAVAKDISMQLITEGSGQLLVDPERLQQAVWNLLSNAVKFTDRGGAISIAVRQRGGQMTIAVTDTGKGIDPEFLPLVFDRFKQADGSTTRRVGGLGLGLAIVRHIVELHGGKALAASPGVGKGSTFTLVLPIRKTGGIAPEPRVKESDKPGGEQRLQLKDLRILVVDDEPDTRELMETILAGAGAQVESASSVAAGLEALQRFAPHAVLSDIGMPGQDGIAFIKQVRALPAQAGGLVPAVAVTAYTREEDKLRSIAAGFTTHLEKPVDVDHLINVVASVAGRFQPAPGSLHLETDATPVLIPGRVASG